MITQEEHEIYTLILAKKAFEMTTKTNRSTWPMGICYGVALWKIVMSLAANKDRAYQTIVWKKLYRHMWE